MDNFATFTPFDNSNGGSNRSNGSSIQPANTTNSNYSQFQSAQQSNQFQQFQSNQSTQPARPCGGRSPHQQNQHHQQALQNQVQFQRQKEEEIKQYYLQLKRAKQQEYANKIKEPILFYSKHCAHSIKFIQLLHRLEIIEKFKSICVDPIPQTRKRQPEIIKYLKFFQVTQVPTIILQTSKLIGNDAVQWVLKTYDKDEKIKGFSLDQIGSTFLIFDDEDEESLDLLTEYQMTTKDWDRIKTPQTDSGGKNFSPEIINQVQNYRSNMDSSIKEFQLLAQNTFDGKLPFQEESKNNNTINFDDLINRRNREYTPTQQQQQTQFNDPRFNPRSGGKTDELNKKLEQFQMNRDSIFPQRKRPKTPDFSTGEPRE